MIAMLLHVRGATVEMHRDDRLRLRGDRGRDRGGIDQHGAFVDVDEDGARVGVKDRLHGREEGLRDGDDLIAGGDTAGADRELQCVGAGAHADPVLGSDVGGKLLIERPDVGADGELHALEDIVDRLPYLVADGRVLGAQVDEWNLLRCDSHLLAPSLSAPSMCSRAGMSRSHAYAWG